MTNPSPFSLNAISVGSSPKKQTLGNGGFLFGPTLTEDFFCREQFDEEQLEFINTVKNFVDNKVVKRLEEIEEKKIGEDGVPVLVRLLKETGELGIFGIDVPEEYDGLEMDFVTTLGVYEKMNAIGSYSVTCMAHTGIGKLPILFFGTEEQKKKYLPKLISAEWLSCYSLTEPGSGSDALSGKTKAVLEGDHYILNGSKQFITNGGWADLSIVFANIDGKYSGLIVELNAEGVVRGAEEKKMGLKGSSTTTLTFENVKVPKENLLGRIGDAANIALNTLNMGRLDLAIAAVGGAKYTLKRTLEYATERKQFGRTIAEFDMQIAKLGDMCARLFASDSMVFRICRVLDQKVEKLEKGPDYFQNLIKVIRSMALEVSIVKVEASEMLHQVACDAVKIHGGYGYIQEYEAERALRDCIINMIFEGTNDINRLVIFDFFMRSIYSQGVPFHSTIEDIRTILDKRELNYPDTTDILFEEKSRVYAAKHMIIYLVQECILKYGKDIKNNQQLMAAVSDFIVQVYAADSTLARSHYLMENKHKEAGLAEKIAKLNTAKTMALVRGLAQLIAEEIQPARASFTDELAWLSSLTQGKNAVMALRREIGKAVVDGSSFFAF